jgi:hypothetical protein
MSDGTTERSGNPAARPKIQNQSSEGESGMTFKPKIALLGGTGKLGTGLALRWASNGYPVIIGSRTEEKALAAAEKIREMLGQENIQGMENGRAAREGEINVLTVVAKAHQAALESLHADLQGKILVDATARITFPNPKPPAPPSAAKIAQEMLGEDVRVVAAYQNVPASMLKDLGKPIPSDILICADDREAADQVIELTEGAGMRAYYAGDLDLSVTVEGLTAVLVNLNKYNQDLNHASIQITSAE